MNAQKPLPQEQLVAFPALDQWRAIVDGPPRIARERFGWERGEAAPVAIDAIVGSGSWA